MTSALEALLGAKPVSEITEEVEINRLGEPFIVKALTGDDLNKIREQATKPVKSGKKTEMKVNEDEVARLIIAEAVTEPNFNDAKLLKHFGAIDGGDCVQKALLAGEITKLQKKILELSGFADEYEELEEVKN